LSDPDSGCQSLCVKESESKILERLESEILESQIRALESEILERLESDILPPTSQPWEKLTITEVNVARKNVQVVL